MSTDRIHQCLSKVYSEADVIDVDVDRSKWVIFSDHHRGRGDGADDFKQCEEVYLNALDYYLKNNYHLILLGDVEELWENPLALILARYQKVIRKEMEFYANDRLFRIWGNHDDVWQYPESITKYFKDFFPNINIYESLRLKVRLDRKRVGEIFLVHGHQGTLDSDRFSGLSKFFVKHIWRNFQRLFKRKLSTPSGNLNLRTKHDNAMYNWAENKENLILVCGHTHQPVFMSKTHVDQLKIDIQAVKMKMRDCKPEEEEALDRELNMLLDKLESIQDQATALGERKRNVYFNTGCCSFSTGYITGLEIGEGKVSLVKWSKKDQVEPEVKRKEKLSNIF